MAYGRKQRMPGWRRRSMGGRGGWRRGALCDYRELARRDGLGPLAKQRAVHEISHDLCLNMCSHKTHKILTPGLLWM